MPFCPSCTQEYRAEVKVCPSCEVSLVDHLEERGTNEDLVDVYACVDPQLAELVVDLLRDAGLSPMLRERSFDPFPTNMGTGNEVRIAVPAGQREAANVTLQGALADGVLEPDEGQLPSEVTPT
jgi:hypothetical protein